MFCIYDSENYVAVHIRYPTKQPGRGVADVFEIVDKHREVGVLLQDEMAEAFAIRIRQWKANEPDQSEVEDMMHGLTVLANNPLWCH